MRFFVTVVGSEMPTDVTAIMLHQNLESLVTVTRKSINDGSEAWEAGLQRRLYQSFSFFGDRLAFVRTIFFRTTYVRPVRFQMRNKIKQYNRIQKSRSQPYKFRPPAAITITEITMTSSQLPDNDDGDDDGDGDDDDHVVVKMHDNPERFPYVLARGDLANLSALRGTDADTRNKFLEERDTNPTALEQEAPSLFCEVEARLVVTCSDQEQVFDANDNENGDNDEPTPSSSSPSPSSPVQGTIYVTNTQILFVSKDTDDAEADIAVGGTCIILHALSDNPEPSLYLQLQCEDDMVEMTVFCNTDDCQVLFDALCKLIALHPVEGDDDDGGMMGMMGMMGGMMVGGGMIGGGFGDDVFGDYGEPDSEWVTSETIATQQEREAMLERLDNLLVIAPGLEAQDDEEDGRFDDPEE